MTSYVLVHGASHGGWCWRDVAALLRKARHDVFAPSMTGLADRSHLLNAAVDVHTHIADIANLILWEELDEVVLVGHSYGGRVIMGVADQMPERIAALIYLDASVPGVSDPWPLPDDLEPGAIGVAPPDAAFYGVGERHRSRVNRLLTPQPIGCFRDYEPRGFAAAVQRHVYLVTPDWPCGDQMLATFDRLAVDPRWERHRVARGHDMMIDYPNELAAYLLQFSKQPA